MIQKSPLNKGICHSEIDDIKLTDEEIQAGLKAFIKIKSIKRGILPGLIVVNENEREFIIDQLKREKEASGRMKAYIEKLNAPKIFISLTPEQMFEVFKIRANQIINGVFIIDQDNVLIIKKLCLYFTKSPDCEKYGIDLNKGIMLAGGLGTGKTTIMKAFTLNQRQSYVMKKCRHIGYDFAENGFKIIKHFDYIETCPENMYGQTEIGICFDDLGTEEERKHWGNNINAMAEILQNRYDTIPNYQTHITTNLNANQIEEIYGQRVRSRTREVFNLLSFEINSIDRRK